MLKVQSRILELLLTSSHTHIPSQSDGKGSSLNDVTKRYPDIASPLQLTVIDIPGDKLKASTPSLIIVA